MTHEDLRKAAVKWLTGTMGCSVVLSEIVTAAGEIPDAIGWKYGCSHVVECKVSRSDWRANDEKCHERMGRGVGHNRYFLCPAGMIQPEEVGDGWGLLWWVEEGKRGYIRKRKNPEPRETNHRSEIDMLVSALRRVKAREFLILVPEAAPEVAERSANATD